MSNVPLVAVLTGDLIASQRAGPEVVERAMQCLKSSANDLSKILRVDTRFTRFRGDGWQIMLGNAGHALRACLIILADLRASGIGIETRIAAGIGKMDNPGTTDLSDAAGEAFLASGRGLDLLTRQRRLTIAGGQFQDHLWQAAIFDLVDWISNNWTRPQANAAALALRPDWRTHQDLAKRIGISRQAMQSRLASGGFAALDLPILAFENWNGGVPA
jgi:hypothetical protein